jgi:hypothetical protein
MIVKVDAGFYCGYRQVLLAKRLLTFVQNDKFREVLCLRVRKDKAGMASV